MAECDDIQHRKNISDKYDTYCMDQDTDCDDDDDDDDEGIVDDLAPALHLCTYPGCSKTFSKPSRLRDHERVHSGVRPYVCSVQGCEKSYSRAQHLKRHTSSAHHDLHSDDDSDTERKKLNVASSQSVVCDTCGKAFSNSDNMAKHVKQVHSKTYSCSHTGCDMSFNKKHQLRNHVNFDHKGLSLTCDFKGCNKSFDCLSRLKHHRKA